MKKRMVLFSGGGTLGPVMPLIALIERWRDIDPDLAFIWVGTPKGPEKEILKELGIEFIPLSAPKLSRHRKWIWPFIPFHLFISCLKSWRILKKYQPLIMFTAGGYVSIPIFFMGWLMRIPGWVHQLDLMTGLANKVMAPMAKGLSITWEESAQDFKKEADCIGSLMRSSIHYGQKDRVFNKYPNLDSKKKTILVLGGGGGALAINQAISIILPDLLEKANVIHLTGKGKMIEGFSEASGYLPIELAGKEMLDFYDAADIVVSRAGMGTILELSTLKKPSIMIPRSHIIPQKNAAAIAEAGAAKIIWQLNPQILRQEILKLLNDDIARNKLSERMGRLFHQDITDCILEKSKRMMEF